MLYFVAGQFEDENVQYFLAVAEIQKSNEVLRQQLQYSEKNLGSLNNDVKGTWTYQLFKKWAPVCQWKFVARKLPQLVLPKLQQIVIIPEAQALVQNLQEINKELSASHKKRDEERKKTANANSSLNQEEKKNARKEKLEKEEQEILQKVRGTIKVYKDIKVFFKDLLPKIAPSDNKGIYIQLNIAKQ